MRNFILLLLILSGSACSPKAIFEQYQAIPDESWSRYNIIEFTTSLPDSGLYEVKLCLRHTTDYEMANLWCFVTARDSTATLWIDTVNLKIADPDGRWKGQGGTVKTLEQPLRHHPVMLPQGKIIFHIEQGMRSEKMKGIKDVGIKVERIDRKKEGE